MLGDWVMFRDTSYIIATISSQDMVMVAKGEETKFCKAESLKPILLSAKLLTLNGFNHARTIPGIQLTVYKTRTGETNYFALNKVGKKFYVPLCNGVRDINYVHELQHYLRLVGLTELANNFKIK